MARSRRAVVLLLVLASLALAAALVAPLATLSGVEALASGRQADALRHALAAESLVAVLPALLRADRRLQRELDQGNRALVAFELDGLRVEALVQDDTAKLPLPRLAESSRPGALQRGVQLLQSQLLLPGALRPAAPGSRLTAPEHSRSAPPWTGCLDDLLAEPDDACLFGRPDSDLVWTHYVSFVGRCLHVYRADPAVLEASLVDLQPGLGQRLARARDEQAQANIAELLAGLELPAAIRRQALERLTDRRERYSLLIRTTLGHDTRQRYVVCDAADPPCVLVNWELAP